MDYLLAKWIHVVSSTLLFGTGIGSAYYLLFTSLGRNAVAAASVARLVVIADWIFTASTLVIQPVTGLYLAHRMGLPWGTRWIAGSIVLYLVAGACWLPVVWIQVRMRRMAQTSAAAGQPLPASYFTLLKAWVALGIPAFAALLVVFWLMVAKPA